MKVGDMVLPDFPTHRKDWREDWPDDMTGVIIEKTKWGERVRDKGAMKLILLDDVKLMIKKIISN